MTKTPFNRDRTVEKSEETLNYDQFISLGKQCVDMIISGEMEPTPTNKIQSNTIQGTKLNL